MLKLEEVKLRLQVGATIQAAGGDGSQAQAIQLVRDEDGGMNEEGKLLALQQAAARPRP